jgi:hypothetical protein
MKKPQFIKEVYNKMQTDKRKEKKKTLKGWDIHK